MANKSCVVSWSVGHRSASSREYWSWFFLGKKGVLEQKNGCCTWQVRLKQYILQDSDEVTVATSGSFSTYLPGIQYSIQERIIRVYDMLH